MIIDLTITIHTTGSKRGFLDNLSLPNGATVRHVHCQLLLSSKSLAVRCLACSALRATLTVQATCMQVTDFNRAIPSNHINHRYVNITVMVTV